MNTREIDYVEVVLVCDDYFCDPSVEGSCYVCEWH
jgi:hypothetical protein